MDMNSGFLYMSNVMKGVVGENNCRCRELQKVPGTFLGDRTGKVVYCRGELSAPSVKDPTVELGRLCRLLDKVSHRGLCLIQHILLTCVCFIIRPHAATDRGAQGSLAFVFAIAGAPPIFPPAHFHKLCLGGTQ